jgi:hypothetical protein
MRGSPDTVAHDSRGASGARRARLTQKERDLWPVLMALLKWGDRYEAEDGPPRLILHSGCGGEVTDHLMCPKCGAELTVRDVETRLGPGARVAA